jgi:hypothetical protein
VSLPAIWGSGITWGDFTWGDTTTSGRPVLYVAADGVLLGEAYQGRFRLGRSDWFEPMTPQTASFSLVGEHLLAANAELIVSCGQGMLWKGYVDNAVVEYPVGDTTRTTITATDIISRLGRTIKAPGKVYAGPDLIARWYEVGGLGDLIAIVEAYLATYAPDLSITVTEGVSTGSFPTLTDWYFDAPGPWPKKTLLELLNQAELSSNALMSLQHDGSILVVPRAPSGLGSVSMVDVSTGASTWRRGRDTLINRWVLEAPAYDDATVLDTSDAASVLAYGERTYEVQDFLCTTATHFGSAFRTALASPRWIAQYRLPVGDLSDPWLMLDPLEWVKDGSDVFQVIGVEHEVSVSDWTVTLDLDASQDALNGATIPTPA